MLPLLPIEEKMSEVSGATSCAGDEGSGANILSFGIPSFGAHAPPSPRWEEEGPQRPASQAFTTAFFACARHTRLRFSRAHSGSRRSGWASTIG